MNKKILILGGSGFIGKHLVRACIKKKFVVSVLSRFKSKNVEKKVKYIYCDLKKNSLIKKKLNSKQFDYVVNLSGNIDHSNKKDTYLTHYIGCKNIVSFFLKKKIERFIQIGSCLEYGKSKSPHNENHKINYNNLKSTYSIAKLKATNFCVNLYKKKKFPVTILRLYQIYGPGQKFDRLIPYIIKSCLEKNNFDCSNGLQKKDFLYIDDLINVILNVLITKQANGKIINIGEGKPIKIKSIIQLIKKKIKSGDPVFGKIKLRKDENKILFPNINLAQKLLRFRPTYSLDHGLNKTISYYKKVLK